MELRPFLEYLKILHGGFNTVLLFLFFYQGWLGLKIRQTRRAGAPRDFERIRRHRKAGPIFAGLGFLGFLAGLVLVLIDRGHVLAYPLHFFGGLGLVVLIGLTYFLARQIKGPGSSLRTPHFISGLFLLGLYVLQAFIGLDVLF